MVVCKILLQNITINVSIWASGMDHVQSKMIKQATKHTTTEPQLDIYNNEANATSKAPGQPTPRRNPIGAFARCLDIPGLLGPRLNARRASKSHKPVRVYTFQSATLLETTCHGSFVVMCTKDDNG